MLDNQRALFDIPDDVHYLNCAYMSPFLKSAVCAGHAGIDQKAQPWKILSDDFFTHSDIARSLFARLINAEAEDIAIVPSVSYGIATAAQNIELSEGDKLLILAEDFPSNVYAWRVKAQACGAEIITVERPQDNDWTRAVLAVLNAETIHVVVLPQTHWIDGGLLDLVRIASMREQYDFVLVLDLTQSLGVLTVDVQALEPDFLICVSYKWLLGPYSLGFVYVHPKHQKGFPLEQGWVNRPGAEDFSRLIEYVDEVNPNASRFDMGERANLHLMPVAIAGLKQISEWTPAKIEISLRAYTRALRSKLEVIGFSACDERFRSPHYLGVKPSHALPDDVLVRLANKRIFISKRGDVLRLSPHLYNNEHDTNCLVDALAAMV